MRVRAGCLAAAIVAIGLAAACASRLPPVPAAAAPRYPEFVFPTVPRTLAADREAAMRLDRGWRFLQAGDLRTAQQEFSAALKRDAGFYPADAALGYVGLAQKDYRGALARFDRALQRARGYAPALLGRGDALLGASRPADAMAAFEGALAADPSLAIARQRIQVLQLRVLQDQIASARKAADAGRYADAAEAYQRAIAASPDSAFLYRDLAGVQRRQGNTSGALASLQKAIALDPNDARTLVQMGELFEAEGNYDAAVDAYTRAAALEPGDAVTERLAHARDRAALAHLPPEFADIPRSPRLTRGDLAALIGVRFPAIVEAHSGRESVLITDTRSSWAAPWILPVVRAGIMDVFPNHTFQPRAGVRRADLALAISRLLNLAATSRPALAARWQLRPGISDVPPGYLSYAAVSQVVAAGVMPLFEDGTFRPALTVSGEDAVQVVERAQAVIGKSTGDPTP